MLPSPSKPEDASMPCPASSGASVREDPAPTLDVAALQQQVGSALIWEAVWGGI